MATPRVGGGWVEAVLGGGSGPHCLGPFAADFEDDALGAVFTVLFLVLEADEWEGVRSMGRRF